MMLAGFVDRPRRRRRRRDHRRREHRAPAAASIAARAAPSHDRSIVLDASVEVRSADRLRHADRRRRRRAGLLPGGSDGRLLPAAGPLLRAGGAGLAAGRADGHAGAVPDPARNGAARAPRVAPRRVAAARLPAGRWRASIRRPRRPMSTVGAVMRWRACCVCAPAGPVAAARLQGARLPDALGDPAGHLASGDDRASPTQASKELRAIPGVRNFGAHIGQAFLADEVVRHRLRRELDQHRSRGRLRQDARHRPGDGGRLPRPLPRRADLPEGAHPGGADRLRARRSSSASTAPTWTCCATRPRRSRTRIADITGLIDAARELPDRHPADRGRGRPGKRPDATASSPATSGAPRRR